MRGKYMNYPKIQTIFKRDDSGNIIPEQITKREFEVIKDWTITEKIDGMNIHIDFERATSEYQVPTMGWVVSFHGKTDNAQIPTQLMKHLRDNFEDLGKMCKIVSYFMEHDDSVKKVIIWGEGYGAGIQKGHEYSPTQKFMAYDMWIDGWWLEPLHAKKICDELGIPFVPVLAFHDTGTAMAAVQIENAITYLGGNHPLEGVVATSNPLMLFRDGTPIKWKLKSRDYKVK